MERIKGYLWVAAFMGLLMISLYAPVTATEPAVGMFLGTILVLVNVIMLAIDIEQPGYVATIFWILGTFFFFIMVAGALTSLHVGLILSAVGAGVATLFQQLVQLYFPIRDEDRAPR